MKRDKRPPMTVAQLKVCDTVFRLAEQHGCWPTYREIMAATGHVNVNSIRQHVMALCRKGYVVIEPTKSRGIRLAGWRFDLVRDKS